MLKPGYWRQSETSLLLRMCPFSGCVGGNTTGQYCADGYTGPLCAACTFPGYSRTADGRCLLCEESDVASLVLLPLGLVLLVVGVVWGIRSAMTKYNIHVDDLVDPQFIDRIMDKLKVLTTTLQLMANLVGGIQIEYPPVFLRFAQQFAQLLDLNPIAFVKGGCYVEETFHAKLVLNTVTPVALAAAIVLAHLSQLDACVPYLLILAYIVFPSVSMTVFQAWGCDSDFDSGRYLRVDYNIDCDSPEHVSYQRYAAFMVAVYPIGVPLLFAVLLYMARNRISPSDDIIDGDGRGAIRRSSLTAERAQLSIITSNRADGAKLALREEAQVRHRDNNDTIKRTKFLWGMYKPKYWWFELAMSAHRLALSSLMVVFTAGTAVQVVVAMFICLVWALTVNALDPCLRWDDNFFNFYAEIDLLFVLILSLFMYTQKEAGEGYPEAGMGTLLIFAAVFIVALAVVLTLIQAEESFKLRAQAEAMLRERKILERVTALMGRPKRRTTDEVVASAAGKFSGILARKRREKADQAALELRKLPARKRREKADQAALTLRKLPIASIARTEFEQSNPILAADEPRSSEFEQMNPMQGVVVDGHAHGDNSTSSARQSEFAQANPMMQEAAAAASAMERVVVDDNSASLPTTAAVSGFEPPVTSWNVAAGSGEEEVVVTDCLSSVSGETFNARASVYVGGRPAVREMAARFDSSGGGGGRGGRSPSPRGEDEEL